jgi:hypothetical protein
MCGGLIHPIAGRCKHCKHDLTTVRGARPAAVASLPSLIAQQAQAPRAHANGMNGVHGGNGLNGSNGHAPGAYVEMRPMQQIVPAATVVDNANPILPPRPTGRMQASASQRSSWWKSWPLIVIVLAGIAIVVAVVLMVWPPGKKDVGAPSQGRLAPAPAPERMETNPLPPPSAKTPTTPQPNDPWAPRPSDPVPPPDDPTVDPDDSLKDPFSGGGSGGTFGGLNGTGAVIMSMMRHACDRATTCGVSDDRIKQYCQMVKDMPATPPPASCADAAKKCFDHIDQMSCSAGFDDLQDVTAVTYKFKDCVEAMSC